MKKHRNAFIALLVTSFVFYGCSKSEKAETDTQQTQTANEAQSNMATPTGDTPAERRFPIRNQSNPIVTLVTDFGNMTAELYRDVAPAHADSFVARTREGFYNGTIFHRIIDNFMIQGGDPKGTGMGNAGYFLPAEFSELPHQEGTLSMARAGDPNSASCQFFICLARNNNTAGLDGQYTVFGQLIKGYDVLHKVGSVEVIPNERGEKSKPKEEVYLRQVFVSDADGNEIK